MNIDTSTQALTTLAAQAETMFPTPSPSGTPWQKALKVVNGHRVEAHSLDFGRQTWFEVDRSTEQLTLTQAVAKVGHSRL